MEGIPLRARTKIVLLELETCNSLITMPPKTLPWVALLYDFIAVYSPFRDLIEKQQNALDTQDNPYPGT